MADYEILSDNCKIRWIENFRLTSQRYTQVSGYVFNDKNQILIVKNKDTWTIPGGHPEINETQEQTLRRELMEEACVEICDLKYLGAVEVVENGEVYYQLRYFARIDKELPFVQEWEICERKFVDLEDLNKYIKWSKGITFSKQIDSAIKIGKIN